MKRPQVKQTADRLGPPLGGSVGTQRWWLGIERKWWVLAVAGIGQTMGALDTSIVNTVLPQIRQDLNADLSTVEWVMMIYLLSLGGFLLGFGRLGDIVGHKRVYNLGFVVFTVGSVLCGLASTEGLLIAFRAIQGLGASMVAATAPAIVTNAFPASQRGQALGLQTTMTYAGLMTGPALGGFLADSFGWRSIFFINVPIGIVGTLLAFLIVPRLIADQRREPFDFAGAAMMIVGLAALMFALSKGQSYGWTTPLVLGLLGLAGVLLVAFVWRQNASQHPMLDLSLFRIKIFTTGTASAFCTYMCSYSVAFLLPYYLVEGRGYTAGQVGLLLSSLALVMMVMAPISGYLSDRIGSRLLATSGMLSLTISLFALSGLGPQTGDLDILWRLALAGLGIGMFASPNTSAIMGAAPRHRQGIASGMTATARNLGMVFGVAIAGAVFSIQLAARTADQASTQSAFFGAVHDTYLVFVLIALIGLVTSAVRGPKTVSTEGVRSALM